MSCFNYVPEMPVCMLGVGGGWGWGGGGGGGSLRLASHLWVGTVIDIHSVITVYDHCSL